MFWMIIPLGLAGGDNSTVTEREPLKDIFGASIPLGTRKENVHKDTGYHFLV